MNAVDLYYLKLTMEVTAEARRIPPLKPTTLLLWCVVVVGTSLLANVDFGQLGARATTQQDQRDLIINEPVSKLSSQPTPRKAKAQTTQNHFDPPFQIATNYFPLGGIGLRWSQHFYDNPLDLGFRDGLEHLEESKARRLNNLQEQINALYKPDEPDAFPELKSNLSSPIYLSHIYYKTKWDTVDQESQALASAQNGYVSNEWGECSAPAEVSDDMDLSKKRILSNRVKMGLSEMGTKEEQKNLRQNSMMSHAFGWLPSCELPIERIERNENEQIIEATFSKMAKTHHIQNYGKFVNIFSAQEMTGSRNVFSRSFYTVDHGTNHPVTKLGGIIDGVEAKDISNLTKSKSPRAATFFGQRVEIQPNFINFNQVQILRPEQAKFEIYNYDTETHLIINEILTSSPELLVYPPKGLTFPIKVEPGTYIIFTCLIAPETWGLIQGSVTVAFDSEFMFMIPVTAFAISNEYEIEPMYYSNVNVGEQLYGHLKLKNPSSTDELEILELYSTEDYLKLFWPNQVQVASVSEAQSSRDFSKYLRIEAGAKAKTILTFKFETDQAIDHRVVIHMLTSRGDVLRIPFYFHVYPDLVKFTPSIVDFGLVPFKFDLLKIPVSVNIRNGLDFSVLYLSEVLLPITDKRLDFVIGAWDRESYGNIQVINKNSRRLEEQRRGVVQRDKSLHLFTIILNPLAFGPVDTNVVLVFNAEDGAEFRVDLPIIGYVLPTSNLLTENGLKSGNHFQPWSVAKPALTIDVSYQLNEQTPNSPQLLKSKRVEERLILANTLGTTLKGFEVINALPDSIFTYFSGSSSKQQGSSKSGLIAPGQTIQLGAFVLNLKDLKTTSGRYYSFIHVNGNLFLPLAIQVTDNRLLCSYQPDDYKIIRYQDCSSGLSLDFGNLVPYHPKHKIVNMTNPGSEPIQIDWLIRTALEVQVRFLRHSPPLSPSSATLGSVGEYTSEEMKQRLGIWIQPQQTLVMQITVEPTQRTLMGVQEILSQQLLTFQFIPRAYSALNISVSFRAHDGMIQFLPKNKLMLFSPAFIGQEEHEVQNLTFKSNLKKDVLVKSISVDDPRFKLSITKTKLSNQSEVLKVTFDPNQKPVAPSVAVSVKNATDLSKVLQRVTNQDQPVSTNSHSPTSTEFQPISVKDFTKLRYQQEALFKNRKVSESKTVEATLTVETDFVSPLNFKLIGSVVPAEIINVTKIDFGTVALGSSLSAPLILRNPFNESLKIQLYIGRTTDQMESELRKLKLMSITEDPELNEALEQERPGDRFADILIRELSYTNVYCFKAISISKENKLFAENTPASKRQWYFEEDWLNEYEDAVFLDRESPKDLVCAGILKALSRYNSKEEFQNDAEMWQKIDKFFRELLQANLAFSQSTPQDTNSYESLSNLAVLSQIESLIDQLVKGNDQTVSIEYKPRPVDQDMLDDLTFCTAQQPLSGINQQWQYFTQYIAFPNVIDYYVPIRPILRFCYWKALSPFRWSQSIIKSASAQEGIFNQVTTAFSEAFGSVFNLIQSSITSRKKSRGLRPEDFLIQRARDKNFQPAATISNQFQFHNQALQEQVLKNNGTVGVERNVQNFFLGSKYRQSFTIPPLQYLYYFDVIFFEPHVLTTGNEELQMSLYIKTDKTNLQKIDLTGKSSSPVLELTDIVKLVYDQKEGKKFLHQKSYDLPVFCSIDGQHPDCIDNKTHSSLVAQQLLGKSTLTPLISLKVDLRDVLSSYEFESNQYLPSAFQRLFRSITGSSSHNAFEQIPKLADRFDWLLTFANIGNADFNAAHLGFEDPVTGEISCESGEMFIEPCIEMKVQTLKTKTFHLYLKADYSTAVYKKTLVFQSVSQIQRFPLHVYTDGQVLEFANELKDASNHNQQLSVFLIGLSLTCIAELLRKSARQRQQKKVASPPKEEAAPISESVVASEQQQDLIKPPLVQEGVGQTKRTNLNVAESQKIPTTSVKKQHQPPVQRQNQKNPVQTAEQECKDDNSRAVSNRASDDQQTSSETTAKMKKQPEQIDDQQASSETTAKIKKQPEQMNLDIASVPTIVEVKPEKPKDSVVRMTKKEKRTLEQKKREAEIISSAPVSEQESQAAQVETEKVSQISEETINLPKQDAKVELLPETEKADGNESEKSEVKDVEQQQHQANPAFVEQTADPVNVKNALPYPEFTDKAPLSAAQPEFVANITRPLKEEPKKITTDQVEFQVPSRLKKQEGGDQQRYKRVDETTKVSVQESAEVDRPKAKTSTGQTYQSYAAQKPAKTYQRTVTSVERPLPAFADRRSAQPSVQVKPPVVAQAPQSEVKVTPARVVMDNYFDRTNQIKQFSSQPAAHSSYLKSNQQVYAEKLQEVPSYYERKQTPQPGKLPYQQRPHKDEQYQYYQEVYEPENSYQRVNPGHAYYRNKQQHEEWQTNYDQEDDYDQEYSEETDLSNQQLQYQHYSKRPMWQQNHEATTPRAKNQFNSTVPTFQKTYPAPGQQVKPSFVQKHTYQSVQPVYQQKKPESIAKPVLDFQSGQPKLNQVQSAFEDFKPQEKVVLPTEEVKSQTVDNPVKQLEGGQEEQKANNFYNAFKSISSIFSHQQKKVIQDDERPESFNQHEPNSKRSAPNLTQSGFSLFSNSVFAKDVKANMQNQSSFEFQGYASSKNLQPPETIISRQRELFKPLARPEPMLTFKPLKEYSNAFTDSLDALTSQKKDPSQEQDDSNNEESNNRFL